MADAAAAANGVRQRRRCSFCLPSCFFAMSVSDTDNTAEPPDATAGRLPRAFVWSPVRRRSRTVPLDLDLSADGGWRRGKERTEAAGEIYGEAAPSEIAQAADRRNELPGKSHKEHKHSRMGTANPLPGEITLSGGGDNQQSAISYSSSKCNSGNRPAAALSPFLRALEPRPKPAGPGFSGKPAASRRLQAFAGVTVLALVIALMLLYGRVCTVFCTCVWIYLITCLRPPQPAAAEETTWAPAEEDVESPEYKKNVVLKGLLERKESFVPGLSSSPLGRAEVVLLLYFLNFLF
ncbi:Uncharacterized protein AXF42_Ash020192 [Apostasia shenzhenica]|uniref:Uncharacterized protein n=1 Tax=Apostasia shenzhenica TaxID=1088818 RepID=A0A2H9ZW13_9ASPA|nr:Uncharacterized protein AXF42_Ash020192 [Apostasia shenzhenica]